MEAYYFTIGDRQFSILSKKRPVLIDQHNLMVGGVVFRFHESLLRDDYDKWIVGPVPREMTLEEVIPDN